MSKKSSGLSDTDTYSLRFQDLMDAIPGSTVAKHIDLIRDGGEMYRSTTWVLDGYTVYSNLRDVYSVDYNGREKFEFLLKRTDYKKFVAVCEKRRAEISKQITVRKK